MDRRRLLTTLAGAGAALTSSPSLIYGATNAAPEGIVRFVPLGDAAIVTSAGLMAVDPGLPCVGELARRLDHALRKRKVLAHIARTQTRLFALGSVTLNVPRSQLISDFQTTLDRQGEFVSSNFGPLAIEDLPMFFATSIDDTRTDHTVLEAVFDTLSYITVKNGFWPGAEVTRTRDVFCMAGAMRRPSAIDLIALWPFKFV